MRSLKPHHDQCQVLLTSPQNVVLSAQIFVWQHALETRLGTLGWRLRIGSTLRFLSLIAIYVYKVIGSREIVIANSQAIFKLLIEIFN